MKTQKILFAFILAFAGLGMVTAQDCGYYNMTKGMVLGYQNIDAKGKVTGTTRTSCIDVNQVGASVNYNVKSDYTDAKTEKLSSHEYTMRCENGEFFVDMQSFIDPKSMEGFKDMEISVKGNDMMYPSNLSAGQTLPDANITISAGSGGVSIMNLMVTITNRQVVGTETVTVPAGTFECFKITYNIETKLMIKVNCTVTEYVNMGVGNVKTETFDKKGKFIGSTLLTELKK